MQILTTKLEKMWGKITDILNGQQTVNLLPRRHLTLGISVRRIVSHTMPCALANCPWRNFHRNSNISIYEKAFENVVSWMAVIMLMLYPVNGCLTNIDIAPVYTCGNKFPNGLRAYRVWRLWGQSSSELQWSRFCCKTRKVLQKQRVSMVYFTFTFRMSMTRSYSTCMPNRGWVVFNSIWIRCGKYRHGEVFIFIKGNEALFTFAYSVNSVC